MINFIVKYDNKTCSYFELSGHSGYANIGYDIVCSGVTTACYTTLNILEKINKEAFKMTDANTSGHLRVDLDYTKLLDNNEIKLFNLIIQSLVEIIEEISSQYPKNLKINIL